MLLSIFSPPLSQKHRRYLDYLQSLLWQQNKRFVGNKQKWICGIPHCQRWIDDFHHLTYEFIYTKEDRYHIVGLCHTHHMLCHTAWFGLVRVPLTPQELKKRYKTICNRAYGSWRPSYFLNWLFRY